MHQFRKFFALLFVWAYRGSVVALSAFLFHLDIEMTRRYLEEPGNSMLLLYADRAHTAHVLAQAHLGRVEISDDGDPDLKNQLLALVERLAHSMKVVSIQQLTAELVPLVEGFNVAAIPTAFGYCVRKSSITDEIARALPFDAPLSCKPPTPLPAASRALHASIANNPDLPLLMREASARLIRDSAFRNSHA